MAKEEEEKEAEVCLALHKKWRHAVCLLARRLEQFLERERET